MSRIYQHDARTMVYETKEITDIPSEDVAPVVHGEWIYKPLDKFRKYQVKCSNCDMVFIGNYDAYDEPSDFNFCPNCGATMDEGHGFVLVQTSSCCPEQYDIYSNGEVIGYLRLRNGYFTVECPDCGGELVYEALPLGEGMFLDDEREHFLEEAMKAIRKWWRKHEDYT